SSRLLPLPSKFLSIVRSLAAPLGSVVPDWLRDRRLSGSGEKGEEPVLPGALQETGLGRTHRRGGSEGKLPRCGQDRHSQDARWAMAGITPSARPREWRSELQV